LKRKKKSSMFVFCVVIFVRSIDDNNFGDNLIFLSFYWSKTMEREKERERIRMSCEYERESCLKLVI